MQRRYSLFKCPRTGKVSNTDLNGAINILHIPESLGSRSRGQLPARDRGNGLKTQLVIYRWTNGAGWLKATSYEVMKMKTVNHEPMNPLREPSPFRAGRRSDSSPNGSIVYPIPCLFS
jgi:putative transposase